MESSTAEGEQGGEKDQEICAICLETPTDPHKLPCGHIFDLHCLLLFAVSSTPMQESPPCPKCRRRFDARQLIAHSSVLSPTFESVRLCQSAPEEHQQQHTNDGHLPSVLISAATAFLLITATSQADRVDLTPVVLGGSAPSTAVCGRPELRSVSGVALAAGRAASGEG